MPKQAYFEITACNGLQVRTTREYWNYIVSAKHPAMSGRESDVCEALEDADEIRKNRSDRDVLLYYRKRGRCYVCVVTLWRKS